MFTEPPRLVERIARLFDETPKVDPFSKIQPSIAGSVPLAELLAYPELVTQLRSVGLPESTFAIGSTEESNVQEVIKYLPGIRNTSVSWRLFRILNDLFDFTEGDLNPSLISDLAKRVSEQSSQPNWVSEVLWQRANLSTIVTNLSTRSDADAGLEGLSLYHYLDASHLLSRPHTTGHASQHATRPTYTVRLSEVLGSVPSTLKELNTLVGSWLSSQIRESTKYTSTRLPIRFPFQAPEEGVINHLLEQALGDVALTDEETHQLIHAVGWSLMIWHHENHRSLQILATGHSPFHQVSCPASVAKLFSQFPNCQFVMIAGSGVQAHRFLELAARVPNLSIAGFGSGGFVTETLATELLVRLQTVPVFKQAGFLSHAPNAEWTYGNLQIVRRSYAKALASMIEDDLIHENDVEPILKDVLNTAPTELYGLSSR